MSNEPPSEDLEGLVLLPYSGVCLKTYRPPWTLTMGRPVRVIETSCSPLLEAVLAQAEEPLAAARKAPQAEEGHDVCMAADRPTKLLTNNGGFDAELVSTRVRLH